MSREQPYSSNRLYLIHGTEDTLRELENCKMYIKHRTIHAVVIVDQAQLCYFTFYLLFIKELKLFTIPLLF